MVTEKQYKKAVEVIAKYNSQLREERQKLYLLEQKNKAEILKKENAQIGEFPISVKLYNLLMQYLQHKTRDPKYFDVLNIDINNFAKHNGVGKVTIKELKDIFF